MEWLLRFQRGALSCVTKARIHYAQSSIAAKRTAVAVLALSGILTIGAAAIYFRRKRQRKQPDKGRDTIVRLPGDEPPEIEDEFAQDQELAAGYASSSSRSRQSSYKLRKRGAARRRNRSAMLCKPQTSITSRFALKKYSIMDEREMSQAELLYQEGVESFQAALDKWEHATALLEDSSNTSIQKPTAESRSAEEEVQASLKRGAVPSTAALHAMALRRRPSVAFHSASAADFVAASQAQASSPKKTFTSAAVDAIAVQMGVSMLLREESSGELHDALDPVVSDDDEEGGSEDEATPRGDERPVRSSMDSGSRVTSHETLPTDDAVSADVALFKKQQQQQRDADSDECATVVGDSEESEAEESLLQHQINRFDSQLQTIVERAHNLQNVFDRVLYDDPDLDDLDDDVDEPESDAEITAAMMETRSVRSESTESFVSAQDVWDRSMEDPPTVTSPRPRSIYEQGLEAVKRGEVMARKMRTEMVNCISDEEFLAKLFCVRRGFDTMMREQGVRVWMIESGRTMIESVLCAANRNVDDFRAAFARLIDYVDDRKNWNDIETELTGRKVVSMTFFDVVLDFMIMDAFEDVQKPPSTVVTILHNRWLAASLKETALTTAVWSVLKAKRRQLAKPNGFIAHLYNVSAHVTPALAWGFLGPDSKLKVACTHFKKEVIEFLASVFSFQHVRYSAGEEQLSDDILRLCRNHFGSFMDFIGRNIATSPASSPTGAKTSKGKKNRRRSE